MGDVIAITVHGGVTKWSLSVFDPATDIKLAAFKCSHISWYSSIQLFVSLVPIPFCREENSEV